MASKKQVDSDPNPCPHRHALSIRQLIFRNLTIKGSLLGDAKIAKELVDLVSEKGVEVKTQAYPLEKVHEMMVSVNRFMGTRSSLRTKNSVESCPNSLIRRHMDRQLIPARW